MLAPLRSKNTAESSGVSDDVFSDSACRGVFNRRPTKVDLRICFFSSKKKVR